MCTRVCVRKGPAGRGRGQGEPISEPSASQREVFSSKKTANADGQTPPLTVGGRWEEEAGRDLTFTGHRPLPRGQARLFFQEKWLNVTGRQVALPDGVCDQVLCRRQGGGAGAAA